MKKYSQMMKNNKVALYIDNIQIEGKCNEEGYPLDNAVLCDIYKECLKGSYRLL